MMLDELYGEVPATLREPLADIQTNGRHLLRLINDVLDLSKIEAGRMELALGEYSVQDVRGDVVHASLESLAHEKGLAFSVVGGGGHPAGLRRRPAHHAVPDEPGRQRAEVHAAGPRGDRRGRATDGDTRYRVSDTGIGIPKDEVENIFAEFRQVDTTITREFGGTGLGLSITKKFVEMHGGRIWVESELGKGSTILLHGAAARGRRARMNDRTVLHIEDNEYNRKIVRQLLGRTTFRLLEAADGEEGVAVAQRELPDLILMDVQLPKLSGSTPPGCCGPTRTAKIPLVVVTSFALSGDDRRAMDAGASAYLAKPYSPRDLMALIRKLALKPEWRGSARSHLDDDAGIGLT